MTIVAESPPPVLVEPTPAASRVPTEHRVLLRGVPWATYMALRANERNRGVRMTFDRGTLELMTTSRRHEFVSRYIYLLVSTWAGVQNLDIVASGSMTLSREDLDRGLEGDETFHIRSWPAVRDKEELDFTTDPPPDLAVEVEVTSPALSKLPIYAALGVPEVWLWRNEQIVYLSLTETGDYAAATESLNLPGFPVAQATALIARRAELSQTAIVKAFLAVCRAEQSQQQPDSA